MAPSGAAAATMMKTIFEVESVPLDPPSVTVRSKKHPRQTLRERNFAVDFRTTNLGSITCVIGFSC